MEKFIQDVASGYWWISVVIVGIIINIISSYIKPLLETRLGLVSEYWRRRRETRLEMISRQVAALSADSNLRSIYALREIRFRIRSVSYLVMASILFAVATWAQALLSVYAFVIPSFLGTVAMLIALDDHFDAVQVKKIVEASTEGINELRP